MIVSVTQEHIDTANAFRRKRGGVVVLDCPVAVALQDLTGTYWIVTDLKIERSFYDLAAVPTPPEVRAFMARFDSGYRVEPFTFELPD